MPNEVEVLIVGAGPVGLSAALALAQAKVPIRTIQDRSAAHQRLKQAGIEVERGVELLSFSDTGDQVTAKLKYPGGA